MQRVIRRRSWNHEYVTWSSRTSDLEVLRLAKEGVVHPRHRSRAEPPPPAPPAAVVHAAGPLIRSDGQGRVLDDGERDSGVGEENRSSLAAAVARAASFNCKNGMRRRRIHSPRRRRRRAGGDRTVRVADHTPREQFPRLLIRSRSTTTPRRGLRHDHKSITPAVAELADAGPHHRPSRCRKSSTAPATPSPVGLARPARRLRRRPSWSTSGDRPPADADTLAELIATHSAEPPPATVLRPPAAGSDGYGRILPHARTARSSASSKRPTPARHSGPSARSTPVSTPSTSRRCARR